MPCLSALYMSAKYDQAVYKARLLLALGVLDPSTMKYSTDNNEVGLSEK